MVAGTRARRTETAAACAGVVRADRRGMRCWPTWRIKGSSRCWVVASSRLAGARAPAEFARAVRDADRCVAKGRSIAGARDAACRHCARDGRRRERAAEGAAPGPCAPRRPRDAVSRATSTCSSSALHLERAARRPRTARLALRGRPRGRSGPSRPSDPWGGPARRRAALAGALVRDRVRRPRPCACAARRRRASVACASRTISPR